MGLTESTQLSSRWSSSNNGPSKSRSISQFPEERSGYDARARQAATLPNRHLARPEDDSTRALAFQDKCVGDEHRKHRAGRRAQSATRESKRSNSQTRQHNHTRYSQPASSPNRAPNTSLPIVSSKEGGVPAKSRSRRRSRTPHAGKSNKSSDLVERRAGDSSRGRSKNDSASSDLTTCSPSKRRNKSVGPLPSTNGRNYQDEIYANGYHHDVLSQPRSRADDRKFNSPQRFRPSAIYVSDDQTIFESLGNIPGEESCQLSQTECRPPLSTVTYISSFNISNNPSNYPRELMTSFSSIAPLSNSPYAGQLVQYTSDFYSQPSMSVINVDAYGSPLYTSSSFLQPQGTAPEFKKVSPKATKKSELYIQLENNHNDGPEGGSTRQSPAVEHSQSAVLPSSSSLVPNYYSNTPMPAIPEMHPPFALTHPQSHPVGCNQCHVLKTSEYCDGRYLSSDNNPVMYVDCACISCNPSASCLVKASSSVSVSSNNVYSPCLNYYHYSLNNNEHVSAPSRGPQQQTCVISPQLGTSRYVGCQGCQVVPSDGVSPYFYSDESSSSNLHLLEGLNAVYCSCMDDGFSEHVQEDNKSFESALELRLPAQKDQPRLVDVLRLSVTSVDESDGCVDKCCLVPDEDKDTNEKNTSPSRESFAKESSNALPTTSENQKSMLAADGSTPPLEPGATVSSEIPPIASPISSSNAPFSDGALNTSTNKGSWTPWGVITASAVTLRSRLSTKRLKAARNANKALSVAQTGDEKDLYGSLGLQNNLSGGAKNKTVNRTSSETNVPSARDGAEHSGELCSLHHGCVSTKILW